MIDEMNNAHRWGIFFAIMITLVAIIWFLVALTVVEEPDSRRILGFNGYLLLFGVITIIWVMVFAGIKLELEFP